MIFTLLFAVLSPSVAPVDARTQARAVLVATTLQPTRWSTLHAAEALLDSHLYAPVRARFGTEAENAPAPFRNPIWRFEAVMADSPSERTYWTAKIEQIAADPAASDQVIAIESLDKLSYVAAGKVLEAARELADHGAPANAVYGVWALLLARQPGAAERVRALLSSSDPQARARAGIILRWTHSTDPELLRALAGAAAADTPRLSDYPAVIASAFALHADPTREALWRSQLEAAVAAGPGGRRWEACEGLMYGLTTADLPLLVPHLRDPEPDGRTGAALAILHLVPPGR